MEYLVMIVLVRDTADKLLHAKHSPFLYTLRIWHLESDKFHQHIVYHFSLDDYFV